MIGIGSTSGVCARLGLRRVARRVLRGAVAAVALLACGAPSASAVIAHLRGGRALSYQPLRGARAPQLSARPFDALFENLDYNGGPVMPSNTNYTIYWSPGGSAAYPSGYQAGVNRYLVDLAHDSGGHQNVDSVSTQYNDAAGEFANYESHFGGTFLDEDPYPANGCAQAGKCLTDAQLQAEIKKFVEREGLPMGLTAEYFLLTPPKVEDCFESAGSECSAGSKKPVYCAYHGNIPVGATQIIYSNDPYVSFLEGCDDGNHPNGNASDGALQGGLSHEHNESITDPEPNNAWTDFGSESGGEIGDKCGGAMGESLGEEPVNKAAYNQVINGRFYWYQEEWSNQGHACVQRLAFSGERPSAKITAFSEGGTTVRFDASGSSAPGGVRRYNWQFNTAPGGEPSAPRESVATSTVGSFSLGEHRVALTVFAADGTSIGAAKTVVVGEQPPLAAFVAPATSAAGTPVGFDGSGSTSPNGSVSSYEWSFGDGTSATGVTTSHLYGAPGTYEPVLSVSDASGFTTSVARAVTIGPAGGGGGGEGGAGKAEEQVAAGPSPAVVLPALSISPPAPATVPTLRGSVRLVKIKLNRDGSADVFVRVSGAGLLSARDASAARAGSKRARVRPLGSRARAPGVVKLHIVLAHAGLRAIAARAHLTLKLTVAFAPRPPLLAATPLHVTLRLSRHRRH